MLHTKPQGHWPFGSGEEDFLRVFTIYGHGSHLGCVTQMLRINFRSPTHGGSISNLPSIGPAVLDKKIFENVEKGSGELKMYRICKKRKIFKQIREI